ncbi:hypothetical protein [Mesorhizobium sp. Z1-4]|uniref:hypothetical protein n=1 Tax=Mesorhizobium sp. Z1-4 TaxID=2448478 RepID=UPI000FD7488C|nr:hypothetical protein [Mesorhizobium sp. Z1-4]
MNTVAIASNHDQASLAKSCLAYFRKGKDTMQVAKRFGISEARASKLIWVARSWEKGLPADYDHRGSVRRVAK